MRERERERERERDSVLLERTIAIEERAKIMNTLFNGHCNQ